MATEAEPPNRLTLTARLMAVAVELSVAWSRAATRRWPRPAVTELPSRTAAVAVVPTSLMASAPDRATAPPNPVAEAATPMATPVASEVAVGVVVASTSTTPPAVTVEASIAAVAVSWMVFMPKALVRASPPAKPAAAATEIDTPVVTTWLVASSLARTVTSPAGADTVLPPVIAAITSLLVVLVPTGTATEMLTAAAETVTPTARLVGVDVIVEVSVAETSTSPVVAVTIDPSTTALTVLSISWTATAAPIDNDTPRPTEAATLTPTAIGIARIVLSSVAVTATPVPAVTVLALMLADAVAAMSFVV